MEKDKIEWGNCFHTGVMCKNIILLRGENNDFA